MRLLDALFGWCQFQIRRVAKCDDCQAKIFPGAQVFANNDTTVVGEAVMLCFVCGTKRGLEK